MSPISDDASTPASDSFKAPASLPRPSALWLACARILEREPQERVDHVDGSVTFKLAYEPSELVEGVLASLNRESLSEVATKSSKEHRITLYLDDACEHQALLMQQTFEGALRHMVWVFRYLPPTAEAGKPQGQLVSVTVLPTDTSERDAFRLMQPAKAPSSNIKAVVHPGNNLTSGFIAGVRGNVSRVVGQLLR